MSNARLRFTVTGATVGVTVPFLPLRGLRTGPALERIVFGLESLGRVAIVKMNSCGSDACGVQVQVFPAGHVALGTGEGRLDAQTAMGKTASGVAAIARGHGKRVAVIAGGIDATYTGNTFDIAEAATPDAMPLADAMRDAESLVAAAAERAMRRLIDQDRR